MPTLNNVTFTLTEKSPNGYGVTFIRELRLWDCYDCTIGNKNFVYSTGDINFATCLHCFTGVNDITYATSIYPIFLDSINPTNRIELNSVPEFKGYNLLDGYSYYKICDEKQFQYLENCDIFYNLNRANDFQVTSYSSRTGRYTMEFWFYIEQTSQMSNGINFIWDNHLSITLITSTNQGTQLNAICFPQAYRDKVDGKKGLEVYNLYNEALNKDIYEFYSIDDSWQYIRCAVDNTRKLFRISSYYDYEENVEYANDEKTLEAEVLYGDTRNVRPFKFFEIPQKTQVKFQHFNTNGCRQYLKQFKLFRIV